MAFKKIATILQNKTFEPAENNVPFLQNILLKYIGKDIDLKKLDLNTNPENLAKFISLKKSSLFINEEIPIFQSQAPADYLQKISEIYFERINNVISFKKTNHETEHKFNVLLDTENPIKIIKDNYEKILEPVGYTDESLFAAGILSSCLKGFENRLQYVKNLDEIYKLISLGISDNNEIINLALNPSISLDDLIKQMFILSANNNKKINTHSVLNEYENIINERAKLSNDIKTGIENILKDKVNYKVDYNLILSKIKQELKEKKNMVIFTGYVTSENEYKKIIDDLISLRYAFYKEVPRTDVTKNTEYIEIQKKIDKEKVVLNEINEKNSLHDLEKLILFSEYCTHLTNSLIKNENIAYNPKYIVFKNLEEINNNYKDKIAKFAGEVLENTKTDIPGNIYRIISMKGFTDDNQKSYFHGGDENDIKIGKTGELVRILNKETFVLSVKHNKKLKEMLFHPGELLTTNTNRRKEKLLMHGNNPETIAGSILNKSINDIEKLIINRTKERIIKNQNNIIDIYQQELNKKKIELDRGKINLGDIVCLNQALGKNGKYFHNYDTLEFPIGTPGRVLEKNENNYYHCRFNYMNKDAFFCEDELIKIEQCNILDVKGEFSALIKNIIKNNENKYHEKKKQLFEYINLSCKKLKQSGLDDFPITLFFGTIINTNELLENKILELNNPFAKYKGINLNPDYKNIKSNIEQKIFNDLGLIPEKKPEFNENPNKENFKAYIKNLEQLLFFGYVIDNNATEIKDSQKIINFSSDQMPKNAIGIKSGKCNYHFDGIHVEYLGKKYCMRQSEVKILKRANELCMYINEAGTQKGALAKTELDTFNARYNTQINKIINQVLSEFIGNNEQYNHEIKHLTHNLETLGINKTTIEQLVYKYATGIITTNNPAKNDNYEVLF